MIERACLPFGKTGSVTFFAVNAATISAVKAKASEQTTAMMQSVLEFIYATIGEASGLV